jgi:uncharacterized membrane protein YccC
MKKDSSQEESQSTTEPIATSGKGNSFGFGRTDMSKRVQGFFEVLAGALCGATVAWGYARGIEHIATGWLFILSMLALVFAFLVFANRNIEEK